MKNKNLKSHKRNDRDRLFRFHWKEGWHVTEKSYHEDSYGVEMEDAYNRMGYDADILPVWLERVEEITK